MVVLSLVGSAWAQELLLRLEPAATKAEIKLDATAHTVDGSFALKHGELHLDPRQNKVCGEIVFDATSGQTGNDRRDRKMHKEVLESGQYPEITFRPDKFDGKVALQGSSTVQVHGLFVIHGFEKEITSTVQLDAAPDKWTGEAHFVIPYVDWGLKNPSTFLLRVGHSVAVDMHFVASVSRTQ